MRTTILFIVLACFLSYQSASGFGSGNRMAVVEKPRTAGSFFDLGQGAVRVLAVVPLSNPASEQAISSIVDVFATVPSNRVRAFIVFSPAVPADDEFTALQRFGKIHDGRFVGFWDPTLAVSDHWRVPAGLSPNEGCAVYLYETGTRFVDVDTIAPFWSHRPGEEISALQTKTLQDSVLAMLGRFARRTEVDEEARANP